MNLQERIKEQFEDEGKRHASLVSEVMNADVVRIHPRYVYTTDIEDVHVELPKDLALQVVADARQKWSVSKCWDQDLNRSVVGNCHPVYTKDRYGNEMWESVLS